MKTSNKISVAMIAVMAVVSLSSCSVEYRARHPRPKRVIVVGKASEQVPVNKEVSNNTVQTSIIKN